jgi:nucleotide-binding universal stress UspA family protein
MFLNILVGLDGSPSSLRALERAAELAQSGNAKLTLMTVAPTPSSYVTLAGVSPNAMQAELDRWAGKILEDAAATLPDDIAPHRVQGRGHAGHELLKELKHGGYDLVVLGSRGRNRAEENLLGSVNSFIHFHGHVPLLTVPE